MTVAIVGCGAMGSLFGALLARAGHEVWMIDNHPRRARIMAADGIHIESAGAAVHVRVNAVTDPAQAPTPDFAFVFVKAYATAAAAEAAARLAGPHTTLVTLQNGLGNVETLVERFGAPRVIGGATAHGATEVGAGHVRHAGVGPTVIARADGERTEQVERLAGALTGAGIETAVSDDLPGAIWSKLVVNCGINAVGALTRLPNGALAQDPGAAAVVRAAAEEAAAVARALGISLAYDDAGAHSEQVCRATAKNVNSMLQDVLRHRRTEVEAINGAVARRGREAGVATPVNGALAALVGAIERGYERQAA